MWKWVLGVFTCVRRHILHFKCTCQLQLQKAIKTRAGWKSPAPVRVGPSTRWDLCTQLWGRPVDQQQSTWLQTCSAELSWRGYPCATHKLLTVPRRAWALTQEEGVTTLPLSDHSSPAQGTAVSGIGPPPGKVRKNGASGHQQQLLPGSPEPTASSTGETWTHQELAQLLGQPSAGVGDTTQQIPQRPSPRGRH